MFFDFGTEGFISLFVIIFVCLFLFFYLKKAYFSRIQKETDLANKQYGVFLLTIGSIVTLSSLFAHIYFQFDLARSSGIFKMLSEISASPMLFFTIVFFVIGLTMFFLGISVIRLRKTMLEESS